MIHESPSIQALFHRDIPRVPRRPRVFCFHPTSTIPPSCSFLFDSLRFGHLQHRRPLFTRPHLPRLLASRKRTLRMLGLRPPEPLFRRMYNSHKTLSKVWKGRRHSAIAPEIAKCGLRGSPCSPSHLDLQSVEKDARLFWPLGEICRLFLGLSGQGLRWLAFVTRPLR